LKKILKDSLGEQKMENNDQDLNRYQIIRKDARNCFVETKSDCFANGKVHLEFSSYDVSRPAGQRQTNHVNIYIDVPDFLLLTNDALTGSLHMRAQRQKQQNDNKPLYEHLGGTSAQKLAQYGRPRPDGRSQSRIVKLIIGQKVDYLFVADSGPGDADSKGLIVPRFGKEPENHVSVGLSWSNLNALLLMTQKHYEAWLAAQYVAGTPPTNK
jgi:hypothetical protein